MKKQVRMVDVDIVQYRHHRRLFPRMLVGKVDLQGGQ